MQQRELIMVIAGATFVGSLLAPWSQLAGRRRSGIETWQVAADLSRTLGIPLLRYAGWLWLAGVIFVAAGFVISGQRGRFSHVLALVGPAVGGWVLVCAALTGAGNLSDPPFGPIFGLLSATLLVVHARLFCAKDAHS